jgi:amino acid transporter
MKNTKSLFISEVLLAIAIIIALILLINPFNLIMTSAFTLTIIMILAVALIAFGVFVWREKPRDEREALHGLQASRISYFLGSGVLVIAIIVQSLMHHLDVWLAVALGVMVLAKLFVGMWSRHK